ncbi:MAG: protease modulator HflC [Deltaproteobacteria bacterium]|nr:protease modulator HflC [Deltaproteobacteria bacterium]
MIRKIIIGLGIIVVLVYVLITALVAVDVTEIVVITQFGKPVRVVTDAGLAIKWPDPVQTVIRLDKRLQGLDSNVGEYLTNDKKNLVLSNFILWRIIEAEKFIRTVKDLRSAERRLSDLVNSELGVAIGKYPLPALLRLKDAEGNGGTRIPEISEKVVKASRKQALDEFGIEIVDVRLRRLSFPEQNLRSVYDRMRAERERQAKKYRAEGDEAAAKIRSNTDREVREILATAYREAQVTKGQGDAKSIRIYAEALEKDPKFYKLTRTLEAYGKFLDQYTTLILSTDSPLFRYLESPPEE